MQARALLAQSYSKIDELSARIESASRLVRGPRPVAPALASAARTDAAAAQEPSSGACSGRAIDMPLSSTVIKSRQPPWTQSRPGSVTTTGTVLTDSVKCEFLEHAPLICNSNSQRRIVTLSIGHVFTAKSSVALIVGDLRQTTRFLRDRGGIYAPPSVSHRCRARRGSVKGAASPRTRPRSSGTVSPLQ